MSKKKAKREFGETKAGESKTGTENQRTNESEMADPKSNTNDEMWKTNIDSEMREAYPLRATFSS